MGASFEMLKKAGWVEERVAEMMGLVEEVPFNVADNRVPNGIRFHVLDIWVDELERVGLLGEDGNANALERLLEPVRKLANESPTKAVRKKAKETLGEERLPGNEKNAENEKEDNGWGGIKD